MFQTYFIKVRTKVSIAVIIERLTARSIRLRLVEGADVALGMQMIKLAPNIRDRILETRYKRPSMGDLGSPGGAVKAFLGEELAA